MALLLNANDSVNRSYTITKPSPNHPLPVVGVGELETTGEHSGQYKIPISSGGVTTNIYLGNTQTVRQVKKLVLNGTENWAYGEVYSRFVINVADFASFGLRLTPFISNVFGSISDGRPLADATVLSDWRWREWLLNLAQMQHRLYR